MTPPVARTLGYLRLMGPGYLQSAMTLGGGTAAASLFAGAAFGYSLLWVAPVAMLLGVVMLSAISYQTLSTGVRPYEAMRRYAGEPFFFAHAKERNAPQTYAAVLNYFVIFCVFIFLLVTLYIDVFQYFIGAPFRAGLGIVPILLIANLLLGVYVNLSIWYKLTDRTLMGAVVSIGGALVTVVCLLWWVPRFGYMGAAWATLVCYASMVLASYLLGRKYYPVPYDVKRVLGYIGLGIVIYLFNRELVAATGTPALLSATVLLLVYLAIAYALDGRKLRHGRLD